MTQQEAQQLSDLLAQIWIPAEFREECGFQTDDDCRDDEGNSTSDDGGETFEFFGQVTPNVHFVYHKGFSFNVEIVRQTPSRLTGWILWTNSHLSCMEERASFMGNQTEFAQFAYEWLPSFRARCFLSSIPLERSFTEQAEWLQLGRELGLSDEHLNGLIVGKSTL